MNSSTVTVLGSLPPSANAVKKEKTLTEDRNWFKQGDCSLRRQRRAQSTFHLNMWIPSEEEEEGCESHFQQDSHAKNYA